MKRTLIRFFSLHGLLLALLLTGCGHKNDTTQASEPWDHGLKGIEVNAGDLPHAELDTLNRWITADVRVTGVKGRSDQWIVQHGWMRIHTMPERLLTMADFHGLLDEGFVEPTTVAFVHYRYSLTTSNLEAVQESVASRVRSADWPPQQIRDALESR